MTKAPIKSMAFAISSFVLLGTAPAFAGADSIRAEAYFNAISGGDAETITSFYADDAEFHWVGGPLAGVYKGKDKIRAVWEKFSKAAGALNHEVLQLSESANGRVTTVTARVKFKGEGEVPVKFVMIYKEGKIASEVWQVDKTSPATARNDAKPETKAEAKVEPKPEAKPEVKPEAKAEAKPQAKAEPETTGAPLPTAAVINPVAPERAAPPARSTPDQVAEAEANAPAAEDDDYLPKSAKPGQAGTAAPAPAAAAPAAPTKPAAERKAKTAEAPKPRKRRYRDYDDDDYRGYGHGYRGYGGGYGDGYGYGYGGWRGYGGYGGYNRYGGYGGY
jgi:ketosteroid isomerase-like protein